MNDEIKEQTKILKEILKWMKIGGIKEAKGVLTNTLTDDNKKLVYHFSDGNKNIRDICQITGIKSTGTISTYWSQWKKLGIVESVPAKRGERIKKLFELNDFGIEIPRIDVNLKEKANNFQEDETLEKNNLGFREDLQKEFVEDN